MLTLALVTFLWGGTFLVSKLALREIGPFGWVTLRFAIAAVALAAFCGKRLFAVTRAELLAGLSVGCALFLAYGLQAAGLLHTTSSKSGFITAMYVPLVPVLQLWLMRRAPARIAWLGAAVSFVGLTLLSINSLRDITLGFGEVLTLLSAVASAAQVVLIGKFARDADPLRLATIQITLVTVLAGITACASGEHLPQASAFLIWSALGMGVIGTAFILAAMNWAQRSVSPTRATLIYAMEPVWAGIVGVIAGEALTTQTIAGSILILCGILISELCGAREETLVLEDHVEPELQLASLRTSLPTSPSHRSFIDKERRSAARNQLRPKNLLALAVVSCAHSSSLIPSMAASAELTRATNAG